MISNNKNLKTNKSTPPRFWHRLLRWFCHPAYLEDIEGDLEEMYIEQKADFGHKKARWLYIRDVLLLIRPSLIKPLEGYSQLNHYGMLKNYLTISYRVLRKEWGFTLLNTTGLVLGITCSLFIFLWLQDELKYNTLAPESDRVARVLVNMPAGKDGVIPTWRGLPYPLKAALEEKYPAFEKVGMVGYAFTSEFKKGNEYIEKTGAVISPAILEMFGVTFETGDTSLFNGEQASIIISESFALDYFGSDWKKKSIIGSTIEDEEYGTSMVSGVFKNFSRHATLQFDFAYSYDYVETQYDYLKRWGDYINHTYVQLHEQSSFKITSDKIKNAIAENKDDGKGSKTSLFLQPLTDIYLYDKFDQGKVTGGRIDYVRILSIFGLLVLALTLANFANLTTARLVKRARESGVRKVVGAGKGSIRTQYLLETVIIALLAALLSLSIVVLGLRSFSLFTGKEMQTVVVALELLPWALATGVAGGILAGLYPALYVASINAIHAVKGGIYKTPSADIFRKGLVVFQLMVSVIMIVSAITIYLQVEFIFNKNIGLSKNDVVQTALPKLQSEAQFDTYTHELLQLPSIKGATFASGSPISPGQITMDVSWIGKKKDNAAAFSIINTNPDFVPLMEIELIEGRNFSWDLRTDSANYLINETAARIIGYDGILEQELDFWGVKGNIIGVMRDFHTGSLFENIAPLVVRNDKYKAAEQVFIKLEKGQTTLALEQIKNLHSRYNEGRAFEYTFLEDDYRSTYQSEVMIKDLVFYFTLIAAIVSCIGLFALVAYTVAQRTKEIGVRKVMGASVWHVFQLLAKNYALMVMFALLIGLPISYYFMKDWLNRFAYHAPLNWPIFLATGIFAFTIVLVSISYHTIRAASSNPVKSLRDE